MGRKSKKIKKGLLTGDLLRVSPIHAIDKAKKILVIAKRQEKEKIKRGYRWVVVKQHPYTLVLRSQDD